MQDTTRRGRFLRALLGAAATIAVTAAAITSAPAQTASIEGRLGVIWGDPQPGVLTGGTILFEVYLDDGTSVQVDIPAAQRNLAIGAFGKRVRLTGAPSVDAAGRQSMLGQSVEIIEAEAAPEVAPQAAVVRRAINILVKFAGDSQEPHSPAFFHALMNKAGGDPALGIPASVNDFFRKTSWAKLVWQGRAVGVGGLTPTGWLTLPNPKTFYANCGWNSSCAGPTLSTLFDHAVALAEAQGVNMADYDSINIMLNNDLDCCAWGGSRFYNGKLFGVTWNPPWAQRTGIFVHELGHSIGLPHSGWVYHAYDSNWDQMSRGTQASSLQCGSYNSANSAGVRNLFCDEPGSGYIAAYKDHLGWIPADKKVEVSAPGVYSVWLGPNVTGLGTATTTLKKMVKVCLPDFPCTGSTARYLTVEARVRLAQFELSLPNEGVLIHDFQRNRAPIGGGNPCFFNTQSGWAVPIDSSAGDYDNPSCSAGGRAYPQWGLHNAQFDVGQVYSSAALGVVVRVVRRSGNNILVRVIRTR